MIFVITSGDYSDYGIVRLFQNKKDAKRYAYIHPDARIEEWELEEKYEPNDRESEHENKLKQGYKTFYISMEWVNGGKLKAEHRETVDLSYTGMFNVMSPSVSYRKNVLHWFGHIYAHDEEHVLKTIQDYLTQLGAMGWEHFETIAKELENARRGLDNKRVESNEVK